MNQKTDADKNTELLEESQLQAGIEELKRDMRSAQMLAWMEQNRKLLTGVTIAVVVGLIAGGLWLERVKSRRATAASLYQSAIVSQDPTAQKTLLQNVVSDFSGTSYAALAEMQLARVDSEHAESHLQAIIGSSAAMDAWKWQARMDLAELYLEKNEAAKAAAVLNDPVGEAYEQLRQFLLAQSSTDAATRKEHLNKALAAQSYDEELKQKIERMLAASAS